MFNLLKTTIILAVLVSGVTLSAAMPKNNYACHVVTDKTNMGVSFIQANTLAKAEEEALKVKAHVNTEGKMETPTAVLQCILTPGSKFDDFTAQKLLENIPR